MKAGLTGVRQPIAARRWLLHALKRRCWLPARRHCAAPHLSLRLALSLPQTLARRGHPRPHRCCYRRRRAPSDPGCRRRWAATRPQTGCPAAAACPAALPAAAHGTGRRRRHRLRSPRGVQPRRRRQGAPHHLPRQPPAGLLSLRVAIGSFDSISGLEKQVGV